MIEFKLEEYCELLRYMTIDEELTCKFHKRVDIVADSLVKDWRLFTNLFTPDFPVLYAQSHYTHEVQVPTNELKDIANTFNYHTLALAIIQVLQEFTVDYLINKQEKINENNR